MGCFTTNTTIEFTPHAHFLGIWLRKKTTFFYNFTKKISVIKKIVQEKLGGGRKFFVKMNIVPSFLHVYKYYTIFGKTCLWNSSRYSFVRKMFFVKGNIKYLDIPEFKVPEYAPDVVIMQWFRTSCKNSSSVLKGST